MAQVSKIDSNITGLRYAEELTLKTLPGSPTWVPLEPNSYSDFGANITTVARNPINPSRQKKKGVVTDLDASGGFNTDLTSTNVQELFQGFLFANMRRKDELTVATIDGVGEAFQPTSGGLGYRANDLLFAKNFVATANNGLHLVSGTPTATNIVVTTNLTAATSQVGTISRVGFQFASGDAVITNSGSAYPTLTTTTKDLTQLGLIPGEWVFIGGDIAAQQYNTVANNGFARVRSIATNTIVFDKTQNTMVTDTGAAKTIRIFFGRVLKNESASNLIVRRSYQLERTLGAPDDSFTSQIQSEYLVGSIPNELTVNIPTAEKVTVDLSFVALDSELRTGATGVKSGTRPALVESDALNTSSDVSRMSMSVVSPINGNPTSLFAYLTEATISINNNVSPNKAVGVLGAFDATAGTFEVTGSVTAYFGNITAIQAVKDNSDVTIDIQLVKSNTGITIDLPLLALGDGRVNIEQDQPITIPLSLDAATGAKLNSSLDHTLMMVFYDYLPTLAG